MEFYENDYQNKDTFICLPSTNFGYGYPTLNTGFIYIQNDSGCEQTIINETF